MIKKNILIKHLIIVILSVIFIELTNEVLNINDLIYNSFNEKLTKKQIDVFFDYQENWRLIGYLIIPVIIFIKTIFISTILYVGAFFNNFNTITFNQVWAIVINSEFLYLLLPTIKILWFYFFQTNYTLEDIQYFYPFSALNITGYKGLEPWLIYPLQTLNVFELAYIIILSYQIGTLTTTNADTGLKIVGSSYIPSLLLWVTFVMFFTLNFS